MSITDELKKEYPQAFYEFPICKNCGEEFVHRMVRETTEHWSESKQCWGEYPSYRYWCGECENEIELED